ncbi:MAG: ketoacyl-ACP synthase III [Deltaproteobacteria bacterium]|nr:ketoacyl-ACP synthase III [Deltaproteobacteria bacterium]
MKKSIIKGTGRYVPERVVTNDDLTKFMDTSDEWIQQRTGIKQRHWIDEGAIVGASDLGLKAANIALERAGWKAEDLDLIIFGTLSPDIFFPGSGCLLASKLGLSSTPTLDIRQQCTGFLYGLTTADAYIKSGHANKILVVGGEIHSTGLDKSTRGRDVTVIFGDGAAAVCVEGVETDKEVGILASDLHTDGNFAESLALILPASREPERGLFPEMFDDARYYPIMDGTRIFKLALKLLPQTAVTALKQAGLTFDDIDLVIPHQANLRINQSFQKIMELPEDKVFHNIQKFGNTTAASIPLALDDAIEQNIVDPTKDTVMLIGLGAGVTWGTVIYRFGE